MSPALHPLLNPPMHFAPRGKNVGTITTPPKQGTVHLRLISSARSLNVSMLRSEGGTPLVETRLVPPTLAKTQPQLDPEAGVADSC